jgi:hypothetical protein
MVLAVVEPAMMDTELDLAVAGEEAPEAEAAVEEAAEGEVPEGEEGEAAEGEGGEGAGAEEGADGDSKAPEGDGES